MTARHQAATGGHIASQTLEHAREAAAHAMDSAASTLKTWRDSALDSAHTAQRHLAQYAQSTGRYVTEQPVRTALIAAAVGALIAGAIVLARRNGKI